MHRSMNMALALNGGYGGAGGDMVMFTYIHAADGTRGCLRTSTVFTVSFDGSQVDARRRYRSQSTEGSAATMIVLTL